ncbi:hypothetical protein F4820DRAFT_308012 [Hypoxylon rubiginosum]|uniref:Uncharacterized protein n=1 Tax=Hypoxylon rubiginosum TaxID=110542 RepID=A0ACB9Z283_9PEZI|nr:hypothetical protein F4820DRAFT_308012 [Hypoxylon rubiginosum]
MRPTALLPILSGLAAAAPTAQLVTREAPSPPPRIASVSYSGSGCPSASPAVDRSGGFDDIALRLNSFEATTAGGVADASVNCQAHLAIAGSAQGWQVGVKDVYVKGHLVLDPGAELDYYVTSFWSEDADKTVTIRGTLSNGGAGRLNQDVTAHSTVPDNQVAYSPCVGSGGNVGLLNVNFRVALQAAGTQYGYFGKDADTTASENWSYVWRRC